MVCYLNLGLLISLKLKTRDVEVTFSPKLKVRDYPDVFPKYLPKIVVVLKK